jgi:cytochrome c oxidase subunit 1
LLVWNLAGFHLPASAGTQTAPFVPVPEHYAVALNPTDRVPAVLNGFTTWNFVLLLLMIIAYGWPVAQFLVTPSPGAVVHRLFGSG